MSFHCKVKWKLTFVSFNKLILLRKIFEPMTGFEPMTFRTPAGKRQRQSILGKSSHSSQNWGPFASKVWKFYVRQLWNFFLVLVIELVERSGHIFTVTWISEPLLVFSIQHALKILEICDEIFEYTSNLDASVKLFERRELSVFYFWSIYC